MTIINLAEVRESRDRARLDALMSDMAIWVDYLERCEPKAAKALRKAIRKLEKVRLGMEGDR